MAARTSSCRPKQRRLLSELVGGDARRALNSLEMMADMAELDAKGVRVLTPELLKEVSGERSALRQ